MKRIIDNRRKEKFMIDDEYLNGMAKLCGIYATGVYISMCRHASKDQESFPSITLMSEELGVGRDSIIKGIKNLKERNVIEVGKIRNKAGKWLNNLYILQDKTVWNYDQVDDTDMDSQVDLSVNPSRPQRKPKSVTPTLRKHIEGNTYKETHISSSSVDDGQQSFDTFYKAYPRKVGKKAAEKKFKMLYKKGEFDMQSLLSALEVQKGTEQWQNKQYIPHPATWLNQGRWEDEVDVGDVFTNQVNAIAIKANALPPKDGASRRGWAEHKVLELFWAREGHTVYDLDRMRLNDMLHNDEYLAIVPIINKIKD